MLMPNTISTSLEKVAQQVSYMVSVKAVEGLGPRYNLMKKQISLRLFTELDDHPITYQIFQSLNYLGMNLKPQLVSP